ncbi:PARP6 polymerase, partial [Smithornis capensis]|nr:PARP6 polymerase [Smithornis capensis]
DLKGQYWTDDDSDGDNESEEFLYGVQGTCAADLYRHPQLDADIEAVKEIYSENAVAVRWVHPLLLAPAPGPLHRQEEVATAWKVLRTEPIVLRLRFSLSQYLDGPEPSIEVFQPSNKEGFGLGLQLKKILGMFTSQQWKHLSNDFLKTQQEKRHSWFKTSGTIKKFRAGLSIFSPIPKSPSFPVIQDSVLKGKLGIPEARVNRLMNRSVSCMVKNPKVEVFGYPPASTQAGVAPFNILVAGSAPAPSQVGGHCKNIPTLEYGFLVQVSPASHSSLLHWLEHPPHCPPSHLSTFHCLYHPPHCLTSHSSSLQCPGSYLEIKKQMDKLDPLAHPLLQWIISSNRSHIVKLPLSRLKFMHTSHQFLLLSSPPAKEARFRTAKKLYGSTFAFHGSHIENWHSILRNGLVNASYTKLQLHGAAYGKGIYLSPISSISFGYSGMGKGQHRMPSKDELVQRYNRMNTIPQTRSIQSRFLQSRNLNCIALCEVGDANINTQDPKIQKEIMRVIGTQVYTN